MEMMTHTRLEHRREIDLSALADSRERHSMWSVALHLTFNPLPQ